MIYTHFNKIILSIFFLLASYTLFAQKTEISGMVADSVSLKPIEGVVVKVLDGKKIIVFATTNNSGNYKLTFECTSPKLTMSFQQMSYGSKTLTISNKTQKLNSFLKSKTVCLREVTVKASEVIVKKDTISFNVGSFKSASDRSIEDVIKKLPGVKVAENGKISYQGQDISKFNIEGLDLLGGKYSLATRNVKAKDVNRVEVVENYQEVKQLEGKEHSDKVAMNLKLKEEAKKILLGTAEAGGGYRENEALYHGVLTEMTFGNKVQFIGTIKANNFGDPLADETIDHFGAYYLYNVADVMFSDNLSSSPSMPFKRYRQKNDLMTSLNFIVKLSEFKTLRVNADYIRDQNKFRYETTNNYFLGNNNIEVKEAQTPQFLSNTLRTNLDFQINSPKLYLNNATTFVVNTLNNHFGLTTNWNQIGQDKTSQLSGIQNRLSLIKKTGKKQFDFNSTVSYSSMPENKLTFAGVHGITGQYYQMGNGRTFTTTNGTSFGYDLSRVSKLSLDLNLRADYDKIYTLLQRNDTAVLNRNDGFKITTSISPEYRLLSTDERYGFSLGLPTSFYNISYKDRLNPAANIVVNRPFFSPRLNGHYILSPFTKLLFNSGLNTNIGDITDFIVNPIQASYKQQNTRSGILAITHSFSSSLKLEYKDPLKLFFSDGSVSYGNTERNILNSQSITNGTSNVGINTSGIADKNNSQNISVSGSTSKDVRPISTSFSLRANYGISSGAQIRQGIKTDINGNSFSVSPNVRTRIVKRLEINYWMSYSQSTQHAINFTATYHQQSHGLLLNYNPVDAVVVYGSMDYNRLEITPKNYKNMQLFDAGVRYKHKKFEVELKLNNLLDTKKYSYTLLNQLDMFSYSYYLNPREALLICKFNL
jgi:hypothetical protein